MVLLGNNSENWHYNIPDIYMAYWHTIIPEMKKIQEAEAVRLENKKCKLKPLCGKPNKLKEVKMIPVIVKNH